MGVAVPVGLWLFAWVWLAAVYVVSGAEVRAGGVKAARAAVEREHIIDLTGAWQVFNPNHSVYIAANVPGTIYTDLAAAGILGDMYYRFNDVQYRWVAREVWTYTRGFKVDEETFQHSVIRLDCHGLDTVADITLNGHQVAATDNMFRRYSFDVKSLLKVGKQNMIEITFQSPVMYSAMQAKSYPYDVPPDCPPAAQRGECFFNFIRKEASSFSWDWGPAFPTVGIWKNISLRAFSKVSISQLTVTPTSDPHESGSWNVAGTVFFELDPTIRNLTGILELTVPGILAERMSIQLDHSHTSHAFNISVPVNRCVKLWWPNGYGDQALYDLHVTFNCSGLTVTQTAKFGFRTVRLVQEPLLKSTGLSFYFEINGRPIFMKGSNWIPADSFQERVTPAYLHNLLTSARDANMNILRVWGGGVYESDLFYELADELGIMIWQDLMFACALYPTNKAFLDNVQQEVTQQVRRLMRHPSIIIWASNNENEVSLAENEFNIKDNYTRYYRDYVHLYIDTIRPIVVKADPSRPFVASSPSNGLETEREGWVAKDPQDTRYGDKHYYNYKEDGWKWDVYPVGRFVSEYGVQSWCSLDTLRPVSLPQDLIMNSKFVNHRQHRGKGNEYLMSEVLAHFNLSNVPSPYDRFTYFIYLTQINQAVAIKTETELYRRSQSSEVKGQGYTMGALYWQLNDIWQAPTWASLEYGGKWKMLHYYAKRFFDATLLVPFVNGTMLQVHLVTDHIPGRTHSETGQKEYKKYKRPTLNNNLNNKVNDIYTERLREKSDLGEQGGSTPQGGHVIISCFRWDRMKPLKTWRVPYTMTGTAVSEIFKTDLNSLLMEAGCPGRQHCFLYFNLGSDPGPENVIFLSYFNNVVGLQKTQINVSSVRQVAAEVFSFDLTTANIAPFVWLEARAVRGRFSDNGFHLVAPRRTIQFMSWEEGVTVERLRRALYVMSLMDIYV